MTRVPSDDCGASEPLATAERLAVTLRRHLLAAAQAGLRTLRETLARIPGARAGREHAPPAPAATPPRPIGSGGLKGAVHPDLPRADWLRSDTALPESYGTERVVLLVRDPHCLFAYWDVTAKRREAIRAEAGPGPLRLVLRTYDVTTVPFDARPPERFQDVAVAGEARSVYAYLGKPATCFVAEIGYLRADGAFFPLARSEPVWTPRAEQPGEAPGRWMTVGWSAGASGDAKAPAPTLQVVDAPAEAANAATRAPGTGPAGEASSWTVSAQRGSWSLVRGGLAAPATPSARH